MTAISTVISTNENTLDHIIIQITDTHLMDQPESEFAGMNPEQSFHAVMKDVLARYPNIDAIIHTGDLAQVAKPETYTRYLHYMQNLNIPFFQTPGNHDDIECVPFDQLESAPEVIQFDHWCIILLNSAVKNQTDGWIQSEQLLHLEQLLHKYHDKYIILACHHHPVAMHSDWIDQHKLKNSHELQHILEKFTHIKAVIYGHVHQHSLKLWNNIQFLSTPSTCIQFKPLNHDFALDQSAPGYRCLHLKSNGEFTTQVHRLADFKQTSNKEISGY